MKTTITYFSIGALCALIIWGIIGGMLPKNTGAVPQTEAASSKRIQVHQTVHFSQTNKKTFDSVAIEEGKTALDLLRQTTSIKADGEGKDAFVTSIDGVLAVSGNREFWAFYINGKQADIGAGSYTLKKGDRIEWKKENF